MKHLDQPYLHLPYFLLGLLVNQQGYGTVDAQVNIDSELPWTSWLLNFQNTWLGNWEIADFRTEGSHIAYHKRFEMLKLTAILALEIRCLVSHEGHQTANNHEVQGHPVQEVRHASQDHAPQASHAISGIAVYQWRIPKLDVAMETPFHASMFHVARVVQVHPWPWLLEDVASNTTKGPGNILHHVLMLYF